MKKMELSKRGKIFIGTTVLLSLLLGGCGSSEKSTAMHLGNRADYASENEMADNIYLEETAMDAAQQTAPQAAPQAEAGKMAATGEADMSQGNNTAVEPVSTNRKLIKNVSMSVETDSYDTLLSAIEANITQLSGYIENLNSWNGSYYGEDSGSRNTSITARIPKDKLPDFVKTVEEKSNVTNRSESVEDVTLQYVDTEAHKKMLQTEQASLLKLLENAENIEDIIAIEARLSEVRYQIESMESTLRTFDNLVDYSTVNLTIQEVKIYTQQPEIGVLEKIKTGLAQNLYYIKEDLKNAGIAFVINIPYFMIWGIVILIFVLAIRLIIRLSKRKADKNKKKQETKKD